MHRLALSPNFQIRLQLQRAESGLLRQSNSALLLVTVPSNSASFGFGFCYCTPPAILLDSRGWGAAANNNAAQNDDEMCRADRNKILWGPNRTDLEKFGEMPVCPWRRCCGLFLSKQE